MDANILGIVASVRQQPADNVVAVLSTVLQALGDHHDRLTEVLKDCLDEFRKRMFAESLISRALKDTASLVKIMKHFTASFDDCGDIQSLKDMCLSFLAVLQGMCGPIKKTADSLQDVWNKGINKAQPSLGGTFLGNSASSDKYVYVSTFNSDGVVSRPTLSRCSSSVSLGGSSCHSFPVEIGPSLVNIQLSDDSDDDVRKESTRKTRHHSDAPIPVSDRNDMRPVNETRPDQVDITSLLFSRFSSTSSVAGHSDYSSTINDRSHEFNHAISHDSVLEVEKKWELRKREDRKKLKHLRRKYKLHIKNLKDDLGKANEELTNTRQQQDEMSKRNRELDEREILLRQQKAQFKTNKGVFNSEKVQFQKDIEQLKHDHAELRVKFKKRNKELCERERLSREKNAWFKSKRTEFYNEQVQLDKDVEQLKRSQRELQVKLREVEETKRHFRTMELRLYVLFFGLMIVVLEFAAIILYLATRSL